MLWAHFVFRESLQNKGCYTFHLKEYIELVDWTGRQLRQGKSGIISNALPPALERFWDNPKAFIYS